MKSAQGTIKNPNPAEIGFLFRFHPFSCHHWGTGPSQRYKVAPLVSTSLGSNLATQFLSNIPKCSAVQPCAGEPPVGAVGMLAVM